MACSQLEDCGLRLQLVLEYCNHLTLLIKVRLEGFDLEAYSRKDPFWLGECSYAWFRI